MQPTVPKITTLSEDVLDVIQRFDASLDMICFCKDASNPILLEDAKPVLDVTQDQFIGIFDLKFNHYFLSPGQVFRLALYCRLELPSIIALLLKASWEVHLAKMIGYTESELQLEANLRDKATVKAHLSTFTPDNHAIYTLVRQIPYDTSMEKSRENVNVIIYDLLQENHFLTKHDPSLGVSSTKDETEILEVTKPSESQQKEYESLKELRRIKTLEFEDKLLLLEQKKRMNTNLTDRYFRSFGNLVLRKADLNCKIEKFKTVLELSLIHPESCYREILGKALESVSEAEKKRDELLDKYARSANCMKGLISVGGGTFNSEQFINYETACKKILKQLYFLLHPDMYYYKQLPKNHKKRLDKLWLELMARTEELVSYSQDMLLHSQPDYYKLKNLLRKVCEILKVDVNDLEIGDQLELLVKKGSSVTKLIAFLKSDIKSLKLHLANLELVQYVYTSDQQTQVYREALLNPETHKGKLKSEIHKAENILIDLKHEIRAVFKKRVA